MPSVGMVTDLIISKRIDIAIKEELSDEKDRENAWKFYKFAYMGNASLFKLFSLMLGVVSVICLFVAAMNIHQGMREVVSLFGSGLIILLVAIGLWNQGDHCLKRSIAKLKTLIDSDPVYWGRIQRVWQRTWIDAGNNIENGFGGTCSQQTRIIERSDGIILLTR